MKDDILTDDELQKRSYNVVYSIYGASQEFLKSYTGKIKGIKPIKELSELSDEKKEVIQYLAMVSFLFNAQRIFLKSWIKDEQTARKFEDYVYKFFEKVTGFDPKPNIIEIDEYIKKQGNAGEVMFLGSRICKLLNIPDAILMFEVNMKFTGILTYGFPESLKNAWENKF